MSVPTYPLSGVCDRCLRDRDDLFQHPDGKRYCADVFVCEARYYVQGQWEERGKPTQASLRTADRGAR